MKPAEVLGRLRNGEPQLPLTATEYDLRRASKAQIDDWMKRKREADGTQYIRAVGRIGSKF